MIFGRCVEKALEAYFCGEDCGVVLFREWEVYREVGFEYKKGETWDRLLNQGVHLLQRFVQDNRGLCFNHQKLIDANLIRTSGGSDLAWLDELWINRISESPI